MEHIIKTLLLTTMTLFCFSTHSYDWESGKWEKILSKNGIEVLSKKEKDSALLAFRAKGLIKTPIEQMIAVLHDFDNAATWNKNLTIKKAIKTVSPLDITSYSLHGMPWPLKDREMVLRNQLKLDLEKEVIIVEARTVEVKDAPKNKKAIQAIVKYGVFTFKPVSDTETYVELFAHIDPKGTLPSWVFNLLQQTYPYNYLKEIEHQANSKHFVLDKQIQEKVNQLKAHMKAQDPKRKVAQKSKSQTSTDSSPIKNDNSVAAKDKKDYEKEFKLPYAK